MKTPFDDLIFSEDYHEGMFKNNIYIYMLRHKELPFSFIQEYNRPSKLADDSGRLFTIKKLYNEVYKCSQYGKAGFPIYYFGMDNFIYTPEWDGKMWFVRDLSGAKCYEKNEINMKPILEFDDIIDHFGKKFNTDTEKYVQ